MIVVENLTKFYGATRALDAVSFTIEAREVVGFLGLNGAGKTTVLKILSGLILPSKGRFTVDGIDGLAHPRALRRQIGFLPDRPPLYGDMTVRQMLRYAGQLNGVDKRAIDAKVDQVVERTALDKVKDDPIAWLSHGYRQRVGIASAIVHGPPLVILDEPISGLDPVQIVGMRDLIKSLAEDHTVLVSSHILAEISQTCDRLLVLHEGKIVAEGGEDELAGGRGQAYDVLVRGAQGDIEGALSSFDGLKPVFSSAGDGLFRARIQLSAPGDIEDVLAALIQAGLGVRQATPSDAQLERVFLRLTQDTEHKGVAA